MQHEQLIKKHLEKRNRNWFTTSSFYLSLVALVFIISCFRFPSSTNTIGGIKLTVGNGKPNFSGDERSFVFYQKRNSGTGIESEQTQSNNRETESSGSRTGSKAFSTRGRGVDLGRLARAVSIAETSGGTRGVALTHNNWQGLKENGKFIRFDSRAASYHSFKLNWKKHYNGEFPTIEHAEKYTGRDRAAVWLKNVIYFYENN